MSRWFLKLTFGAVLATLHLPALPIAKADDCASAFQHITQEMRKHHPTPKSSTQIRDEVLLRGRFELKAIEGHDDVFAGRLTDGTAFIFRTSESRALKEVTAYRFAKEAGFEVPLTTFAEINGIKGSVQIRVEGLPTAADLDKLNGFHHEHLQQADPATRIFDSLLAINDRNSTNYFVRPDGRQVLIDPEQMFHHDRSPDVLWDGEKKAVTLSTVRRFIGMNPERARNLADISTEANFTWALRSMSIREIEDFRSRLKVYRRLYREATISKDTSSRP